MTSSTITYSWTFNETGFKRINYTYYSCKKNQNCRFMYIYKHNTKNLLLLFLFVFFYSVWSLTSTNQIKSNMPNVICCYRPNFTPDARGRKPFGVTRSNEWIKQDYNDIQAKGEEDITPRITSTSIKPSLLLSRPLH